MSLIIEGNSVGKNYTVVSFDLPNSAYAQTFEITDVVGNYNQSKLRLVQFEQDFIIGFIEALNSKLGNVKNRVVAVMGGSLGGNMSVLPAEMTPPTSTSTPSSRGRSRRCVRGLPRHHLERYTGAYLGGLKAAATDNEAPTDHKTESAYITNMYYKPLIDHPPLPYTPPQPIMWYRAPTGRPARTRTPPSRGSTGTKSTPSSSATGSALSTSSRSTSASRTTVATSLSPHPRTPA